MLTARGELGVLGRREGSCSGRRLDTNIPEMPVFLCLLFPVWKQGEGLFLGGERAELRVLERELAPGQPATLKDLLPRSRKHQREGSGR